MAENQDAIELQRRARRRLVGAIALVVFVVIALPIIFDREPKPITQDLTIQIPSQDGGKFSSRLLPPQPEAKSDAKAATATAPASSAPAAPVGEKSLEKSPERSASSVPAAKDPAPSAATASKAGASKDAPRADTPKELAKSDPAKSATPAAPKAAAAAPADTQSVAKASVAKAEPAKAPAAATVASAPAAATTAAADSFVVPLGLFRNTSNVDKVRGWVNSAGYKSFTEAAPDKNGVKVMAGPFASREAAEKARDKLKAKGVDVGPVAAR